VAIWALVRRYGIAELAGTAAACTGVWVVHWLEGSAYTAGLSGSLCESAGYYAAILWIDARRRRRRGAILRSLGGLVVEFGPAEIVDTLLTRPLLMAAGPLITGHPIAGTLAGKAAADVLFYAVVVPCGRLRRGTGPRALPPAQARRALPGPAAPAHPPLPAPQE
jgi:hypothetical protein